ncbi:MAG: rRNA maturation RNase YbeY [Candidatus Dormibacter sp.]
MTIRRAETVTLAAQREAIQRAQLGPLLRRCGDSLGVGARLTMTVRLTDDAELCDLNARFLGDAAATDVLAFPSDEPDRVGDVAISVERALAQAAGDGAAELELLAVHGLLHCLGHDHAGAAEAAAMTQATRRLLPGRSVPDLVAGAE